MNKTGILRKKNIKIAGATGMTIFSLVAVFSAVIAWFTLNQSVGAKGMKITASDDVGNLNKIEIYEYIETIDIDTNPKYSFSSVPSATIFGGNGIVDECFLLGDYNQLSTDHPLLILFTLEHNFASLTAGDMIIKGTTETQGFLGTTQNGVPKYNLGPTAPTLQRGTKTITVVDETTGNETEKEVDCYPLSSAVNFRCVEYSSAEFANIVDSTNKRINILNDLESLPLRQSFVNFASSGAGVTFMNDPIIYSSPGDGSNIQYVAMVVNYDANAISAIYSTYLGNPILDDEYEGSFYFSCDWLLEVY